MSIFNLLVGSTAQQSAGGSGGGGGSPASNTGTITDGTLGVYRGWSDGSYTTVGGSGSAGSITGQTDPGGNECNAILTGVFGAGPGSTSCVAYIYFTGDFSSGPHAFTNFEIDSSAPGGKSTLSAASATGRAYDAPSNSTAYSFVDIVPSSPTPTNAQYYIYTNMGSTTTQDFEWNV